MSLVSSVGPFPLAVVWVLLAWLLAVGVARGVQPAAEDGVPTPGALLLDMLTLGLLGGRAGFVLLHWRDYVADPWAVLRLGDGGFMVWLAVLLGVGWGAWRLRRWPTLRRAVAAGTLAGVLCWAGLSLGFSQWQQARVHLPAVPLQTLQGQPALLSDTGGKPAVVNLWASWCGPCRREMPVFARAQQREGAVHFVFVNQGESAAEVQQFIASEQLSLQHVLLDADSATSAQLNVHAYPTTLFFDSQGRLQDLHMGELSAPALQARIDRLR